MQRSGQQWRRDRLPLYRHSEERWRMEPSESSVRLATLRFSQVQSDNLPCAIATCTWRSWARVSAKLRVEKVSLYTRSLQCWRPRVVEDLWSSLRKCPGRQLSPSRKQVQNRNQCRQFFQTGLAAGTAGPLYAECNRAVKIGCLGGDHGLAR